MELDNWRYKECPKGELIQTKYNIIDVDDFIPKNDER